MLQRNVWKIFVNAFKSLFINETLFYYEHQLKIKQ